MPLSKAISEPLSSPYQSHPDDPENGVDRVCVVTSQQMFHLYRQIFGSKFWPSSENDNKCCGKEC